MNAKTIKFLLVIFLILLAVSTYPFYKEYLTKYLNKKPQILSLLESKLNLSEISQIEIKRGDSSVEIRRYDSGWKVSEKDVFIPSVENLIKSLNEMVVSDMVSKNKANHINYGLDEVSGIKLNITSKNQTIGFVVGNQAYDINTYYIRKDGSDEVYIAKGDLKQYLSSEAESWKDRTVARINKDDITKIEYAAKLKLTVEKVEGKWVKTLSGKKTDLTQEQQDSLLSFFETFMADSFADEESVKEFEKARKEPLKVYNGSEIIVDLNTYKNDSGYYLQKRDEKDADIFRYSDVNFAPISSLLD